MGTFKKGIKRSISITILSVVFIALFSLVYIHVGNIDVNAAVALRTHNRTFTLGDGYLDVLETKTTEILNSSYQIPSGSYEGFTIFTPIEGDPEEEDKLQKTLDSIKVTDSAGNNLKYEIEETESKNIIVKTKLSRAIYRDKPSAIRLQYRSYGLVINIGAVTDIFIPGLPKSAENGQISEVVNTKVNVPKTYPEINFILPTQKINEKDGVSIIDIPYSALIEKSTWIQVGVEQFFTFEIKQKIPKTTYFPFAVNTFKIPVPRDIISGPIKQEVYYTKISPTPYAVEKDIDDNLILVFKESGGIETDVFISGYAILSQEEKFEFLDSGELEDIGSEFDRYLAAANFWQVNDPAIQAKAKEINNGNTNITELIQKTYQFVIDQIDYSFIKKYGINERKGALATLNGEAAVCMEYSDLFITLLRAQGIPARAAFGYGFGTADYESRTENTINHQWAEVYLPTQDKWINVDTTWGEFGSNIIGGDLNHFYSHVASTNPETPSTSEMSYIGSLSEIPEREMEILISETLEDIEKEGSISQEDLLAKYPAREGFGNVSFFFSKQIDILDSLLENLITGALNLTNSTAINVIKLIILLSPFLFILSIVFLRRFKVIKARKATLRKK